MKNSGCWITPGLWGWGAKAISGEVLNKSTVNCIKHYEEHDYLCHQECQYFQYEHQYFSSDIAARLSENNNNQGIKVGYVHKGD